MSKENEKPKLDWVGPSEYSRYRGVAIKTVKDWLAEGRLENCYKIGNNNRKKINWQLADQALEKTAGDRDQDSSSGDKKSGAPTLTNARTAKTAMEAKFAKVKYEMLIGNLIRSDKVEQVAKDMARLTRDSIMTLPDRLAPILAGETNIEIVHKVLTEELTLTLRNLVYQNKDLFKDDPDELE